MAATCEDFYHRRGDRSVENKDFHRLPTEDKRLICQVRSAVDVARDKVTKLRDEVEDKELDVSRETALRCAAESRLEQLVDMYGDPAVMVELRERLPRAGQGDAKTRLQHEIDELTKQEAASLTSSAPPRGRRARRNLEAELEEQMISSRSRRTRSQSAESTDSRYRHKDSDGDMKGRRNRSHSPPEQRHQREGYHGYPPMAGPYGSPYHQGYYPPMYTYPPPPQVVYTTPMMQAGASPMMQAGASPMMQAGASPMMQGLQGGAMSMMQAGGTPLVHSTPMRQAVVTDGYTPQTTPVGLTSDLTSRVMAGVSDRTSVIGTSQKETVGGASQVKDAAVSREQQRQISVLLAELNASKELVKQLTDKLRLEERQVASLTLSAQTQKVAVEAENGGKISDMVEKIYRAQTTRDEAILGRMRVAKEDRDVALLKLEQTRKGVGRINLEKSDLREDGGVSPGVRFVNRERMEDVENKLVENITSRRQRREDITTEEMRAALQERDATVAKCRQLEAEVLKLKRINRARSSDHQHQTNSEAKLLVTQQERDMALAQVRKLEEELQTLQIYYSLHKSLSQEANLRDQFNNTLKNIQGAVKERDVTIQVAQKENNHLLVQIKTLMTEKTALIEQVNKAQAGHKEAQMNNEKLERLVNVLRRKINGLGTKMDDCC